MWAKFKKSDDGNVAMMFAVVVVMSVMGIGLATDGTRLMAVQERALAVADAAALSGAAASEADDADREEIVRAYVEANGYRLKPGVLSGEPTIRFDDDSETVQVSLPVTVDMGFGSLLGNKTRPVLGASTASYLKNNIDPVTIAFALDVSGSMQWDTSDGQPKIDVLKSATKSLFTAIESGTDYPWKLKNAVRSGMSAYNTELVSSQPMSWGWDTLELSVDQLVADGGTDSTPALQNSYTQVLNDRAYRKSIDPSLDLETLREYVIFMTDGDNNMPEFDDASSLLCQDMRASGIEIYSVAFEAPEKGELLLVDCASQDVPDADNWAASESKCMNNGAKGKGKALGHCKKGKERHYFDANNAADFEAAFKRIGEEIVRSNVRLN